MTDGDSSSAAMAIPEGISASDRRLVKRLALLFGALFLLTAGVSHVLRTYSQKFYDVTGRARWIWAQHSMSANEPVAFFAARDIDLPEGRIFTHVKVLGDPEYTLYVNGTKVAGRRVGEDRKLDLYDVSTLVKTGRNRIVIAVRAAQGVGGLLASVDIAPETANWVVTDGSWKIFRRWDPELLLREPPDAAWERPLIVGEPPTGRWNFLTIARQEQAKPVTEVEGADDVFEVEALLPRVKMSAGVAVAVADKARATAFDFGFTRGRLRLTVEQPRAFSRAMLVRYANARNELPLVEWNLRPVVIAPGEQTVELPESNENFRYAMVFARGVKLEVVR